MRHIFGLCGCAALLLFGCSSTEETEQPGTGELDGAAGGSGIGTGGAGGKAATGGSSGTGGKASTGGSSGTGGKAATGGSSGTGGKAATGGSSGTGGTSPAHDGGQDDGSPTRTMLFDDEFDGSSLDTNAWIALHYPNDDTGPLAHGCFDPAEVTVGQGSLALRTDADPNCSNGGVKTATVMTRTFNYLYGRADARIKVGGGAGLDQAFWLLGSNCQSTLPHTELNTGSCSWPDPGSDEIDIQEQWPPGVYATTNQQVHRTGSGDPGCVPTLGFDPTQAFHVYSLIWQPGQLQFLVDDNVTCTLTSGVTSTPMFIILGVGVGTFTASSTTLVDYVRVYRTSP